MNNLHIMRTSKAFLTYLSLVAISAVTAMAQTRTITLTATNFAPASCDFSTNQVITVNSFIGDGYAYAYYRNGMRSTLRAYPHGIETSTYPSVATHDVAVFAGVTNIHVTGRSTAEAAALTITVTTPVPQSMIPGNAVVIPSDAAGPVEIVLESSSDLVNWSSALPGTYGNSHPNRFFRVRAIAQ